MVARVGQGVWLVVEPQVMVGEGWKFRRVIPHLLAGSGYSGKGEQYSYSGYSYSGYHSPGQTYSSGYSMSPRLCSLDIVDILNVVIGYPSYSYGYSRSGHGGSPAGQSRPYYGSGGYEYSRYGDSQGGGRG